MTNVLADIRNNSLRRGKSETYDGVIYVGVLIGLFRHEHREKMGLAIYTYGALLAKVTGWNSRYLLGAVLRGAPLKLSTLADQTGMPERTIRRDIKHLESCGYIITIRKPRGLSFYIINYRPAGKPRLSQGECPPLAVVKLSMLADQGLVIGQQLAACDGINEHIINTCEAVSKHQDALYLQPNAEVFFLLHKLFNVQCGTAEMRFFFTGKKKDRPFRRFKRVFKRRRPRPAGP